MQRAQRDRASLHGNSKMRVHLMKNSSLNVAAAAANKALQKSLQNELLSPCNSCKDEVPANSLFMVLAFPIRTFSNIHAPWFETLLYKPASNESVPNERRPRTTPPRTRRPAGPKRENPRGDLAIGQAGRYRGPSFPARERTGREHGSHSYAQPPHSSMLQ